MTASARAMTMMIIVTSAKDMVMTILLMMMVIWNVSAHNAHPIPIDSKIIGMIETFLRKKPSGIVKKKEECEMTIAEQEVKKVQEICDRYGYQAYAAFDEIYIKTKYELWRFMPSQDNREPIRLMHQGILTNKKDPWHKQFSKKLTYQQLVQYVKEHEEYRYAPITFKSLELAAY